MHDAVQRRARRLTQRAGFDSGPDGLRHFTIVSVCGGAQQTCGRLPEPAQGYPAWRAGHVGAATRSASRHRGATVALAAARAMIDEARGAGDDERSNTAASETLDSAVSKPVSGFRNQ